MVNGMGNGAKWSRPFGPGLAVVLLLLTLGACARPPVPADPVDPFEATNRAWFEANLALGRAVMPSSGAAEAADPEAPIAPERPRPVRRAVRNLGANLSIPSTVVNDLLQFRIDRALTNSMRFAVNTTVGLGGLFDPATAIGLHGRRSDFGETLHVWGMGEGAYVVLPLIGPSTERDALGMVFDMMISPWSPFVGERERRAISAARWAGRLAGMSENADLLDANVIRAADPYAQARLLYLQSRRYHLGVETEDDGFDPYDDLD